MKPAGEDTESHRAGKHSPSSFSSNLPAPFSRATRLKVRHRSSVFAHECSHQKETCQILFVHVVDQNFDQILIVKQVEAAHDQSERIIHSRHKYSVFYIDTEGGENTKTKTLFRNSALKQFKYLCIYAERGVTVEEALKRDGRFIDDLGNFTLSDNNEPNSITERTQKVDSLDQKRLKLRLPRKRISKETQAKLMESRFPGDSYQQTLSLRNDDFGKIQQSFCEVHRIRKLLKLGESVCKVIIPNVCVGTGFVLFDNFILSNAHLFQPCHNGQSLMEGVEVFILFNYEDPEPHTNYDVFQEAKKVKVPPGLLKHFGPMPLNGEACLIGHPEGGVKKMDPTCIIEKEKRKQAVNDHINLKTEDFIIHLIRSTIKAQGIENIMMADNVITYDTFMYHGSSGSPVFDAHGRVCGLHMGGYIYDKGSVIEFAQPVLSITDRVMVMLPWLLQFRYQEVFHPASVSVTVGHKGVK
uniref:Uncharacterized protein n=1 Tax=Mola mola TaxID=94237 RepID=A0A3Q3WYX1_MOLML